MRNAKKSILFMMLLVALGTVVFAAPKNNNKKQVEPFVFDFSKDFYPGVGYVATHSVQFKYAIFKKADVIKNEYIFDKVQTLAIAMPIWMTVKVTLEQDGKISYEYSNLRYQKDNTETAMTPLIAVNLIENAFNTLLPEVFADEAKYNDVKKQFFSTPGMLFAMTNGLTDIRAAKFSEIVKDAPTDIPAKVIEAKINEDPEYSDYAYYITAAIFVDTLKNVSFVYYTNDDDKASAAQGDTIKITGNIKSFYKAPYFGKLAFLVTE